MKSIGQCWVYDRLSVQDSCYYYDLKLEGTCIFMISIFYVKFLFLCEK